MPGRWTPRLKNRSNLFKSASNSSQWLLTFSSLSSTSLCAYLNQSQISYSIQSPTSTYLPHPLSLFSYVISAAPLSGPLSSHYVIITQLSSKSSLLLALWRQKWKREWTERAKQRADERNGLLAWCCADPLSNTCHQDPTVRLRAQKHSFVTASIFFFSSEKLTLIFSLVTVMLPPHRCRMSVFIFQPLWISLERSSVAPSFQMFSWFTETRRVSLLSSHYCQLAFKSTANT